MGYAKTFEQISSNYYLPLNKDIGAIDGISYGAHAYALDAGSFFALQGLPSDFGRVRVSFRFEDNTVNTVVLPYGFTLNPVKIPELPEKAGFEASWEGTVDLTAPMYFDCEYTAVYTPHHQVLPSDLLSSGGQPRMLVLGQFAPGQSLTLQVLGSADALYAWRVKLPESHTPMTLRILPPEPLSTIDYALQVERDGEWSDTEFTTEGSYLVIDADADIQAIRLVSSPKTVLDYLPELIAALAVIAVVVLTILIIKKRKKTS